MTTDKEAAQALLAETMRSIDINYTIDFEVALERLHGIAGRLFREYIVIKATSSAEATEQAAATYTEAQSRAKNLRRTDHAGIRAVLDQK